MSRYILSGEAQQDIREIRDYLMAGSGLRMARYVITARIVAFRRLAKQPGMGHRRADLTTNENLLFGAVFSYLIVYRRDSKPLAIVAVLHAKRDVRNVLQTRTL